MEGGVNSIGVQLTKLKPPLVVIVVPFKSQFPGVLKNYVIVKTQTYILYLYIQE